MISLSTFLLVLSRSNERTTPRAAQIVPVPPTPASRRIAARLRRGAHLAFANDGAEDQGDSSPPPPAMRISATACCPCKVLARPQPHRQPRLGVGQPPACLPQQYNVRDEKKRRGCRWRRRRKATALTGGDPPLFWLYACGTRCGGVVLVDEDPMRHDHVVRK